MIARWRGFVSRCSVLRLRAGNTAGSVDVAGGFHGDAALDWQRPMTRHAVDCEMAERLEDVYRRRTGLMLFSNDNGRSWLETLATDIAEVLDWSSDRRREEISHTMLAIDRMFVFRGASEARAHYTEVTQGRSR
jgi:glycerol-3-phosphate dehydrogenase